MAIQVQSVLRDGPTVVLADDREQTRADLRAALEKHGFSVVAEAADSATAVTEAVRLRPKICLLDADVPGGGISAANQIVARLPDTKIAVLARSKRRADVCAALRAGADGYLLRSTSPDQLSLALAALLRGEMVLPRELTGHLVIELRRAWSNGATKPPRRLRLLYIPRLLRHFVRRLRSRMGPTRAWRSARDRMAYY